MTLTVALLRERVKKFGLRFKRIAKRPGQRPTPEVVQAARKSLERLAQQEKKGTLRLLFGDAAGFALSTIQPYAWQERRKPLWIPSLGRRQRLNVMGFFSTQQQQMHAVVFEQTLDDRCVIAAIDDLLLQRNNTLPIVLVLDNASIHHTVEMKEAQKRWRKQGLRIKFLPPYSPELNPIEMVWKQMKHYWIRLAAFESFTALRTEVYRVLNAIGSEYRISFQ